VRSFRAIFLREIRAYFLSPIAYVLWVGFLALSGYFFFNAVAYYSMASMQAMQNPMMMKINLTEHLLAPLLANTSVIMMLITPLLTMRLLSEEKRTGTLELLLSYPLSDTVVVLGKFLASWAMLALILVPSWLQVALLAWLGQPYLPAVAVGYLGLLLMGGCFLSLGLLASAMTENQIVAAVAAFAGALLLWILGWSSGVVGPEVAPVLSALGLGTHLESFRKGLIDTADLAYLLLFMAFFLFSAIRTLEAKRWKA